MNYLARKIQRAKWQKFEYLAEDDVGADAITGPCLRTYDNNFSVWLCNNSVDDLEEIILALVLNSEVKHFETVDIVLLNKDEMASFIIQMTPQHGKTSVEDLKSRHCDLVNQGMVSICEIARKIANNIRNDSNCFRFSRKEVMNISHRAVKAGRVDINSLHESLQKDIKNVLDSE